jgi:hypothetical protein
LAAVGIGSSLGGCARWLYKPPIPTDYVGWRYTQHNYFRKFVAVSTTSHRAGNYRVTVTTAHLSMGGGGRRVLRIPDYCPPVVQANAHILRANPQLLSTPFVSVDGVRIDQPGPAVPMSRPPVRRPEAPSGLQ